MSKPDLVIIKSVNSGQVRSDQVSQSQESVSSDTILCMASRAVPEDGSLIKIGRHFSSNSSESVQPRRIFMMYGLPSTEHGARSTYFGWSTRVLNLDLMFETCREIEI